MSGEQIIVGDCLDVLAGMEAGSVQCCVTSPPYFGLRDYGHDGQIGLEATPDEYVARLVAVFAEVKRVLRDDGTLWLNLGDSYAGGGNGARDAERWPKQSRNNNGDRIQHAKKHTGCKTKDLLGIPWMVAFALRADGWFLRSEIIWAKPNPMPESVTDRPTKAHEQVFLLSKSPRYYYDADAIKERAKAETAHEATGPARAGIPGQADQNGSRGHCRCDCDESDMEGGVEVCARCGLRVLGGKQSEVHAHTVKGGDRWTGFNESGRGHTFERNKRSVWTVATQPYPEAHFATFPPKLIEPMILAGCPRGGVVLDPFAGSGTTLQVAEANGRQAIGIELNPAYASLARRRLEGVTSSMFDAVPAVSGSVGDTT